MENIKLEHIVDGMNGHELNPTKEEPQTPKTTESMKKRKRTASEDELDGRIGFLHKKYVKYDVETEKSVCLVENCEEELSSETPENITLHYKLVHQQNIDENENGCEPVSSESQIHEKISKTSVNIKVNMDKKEFLKCCCGLVTDKSISFQFFDDNASFKKIIRPYEEEFGININSTNISLIVESANQEIKQIITKRVEKKMISLKFDIITRMGRHFLGINIQYIKDFKLCINTIGVIEIPFSTKFVKKMIFKCLQEFKIDVAQLYSNINADDEGVIKVFRKLDGAQDENEKKVENIEQNKEELQIAALPPVVTCVAHELHVAAYEVIKTLDVQINICRQIIKKLRYLKTDDVINIPRFGSAGKWTSIFSMISFISSQRELIDNFSSSIRIDIDWKFIDSFLSVFKPLDDYSLKLQNEGYTLGDFYRDWLLCELDLVEIANTNSYAFHLHQAMNIRKEKLFENDAFVAALYLDPRFNFEDSPLLTIEQKHVALTHLMKTYEMCKRLESGISEEVLVETSETTSSNKIPPTSNDKYNKLEQRIKEMITASSSSKRGVKQKLLLLSERSMEPLDTNVLDYWKKNHAYDSELTQLVEVALAVPATQLSVDRFYSALCTIITRFNVHLSINSLENIILNKLNLDLIQSSNLDFIDNEEIPGINI